MSQASGCSQCGAQVNRAASDRCMYCGMMFPAPPPQAPPPFAPHPYAPYGQAPYGHYGQPPNPYGQPGGVQPFGGAHYPMQQIYVQPQRSAWNAVGSVFGTIQLIRLIIAVVVLCMMGLGACVSALSH